MTLLDLRLIWNHWRRVPPLRIVVTAVASALGVQLKNAEDKPKPMTPEEAAAFMAQTGGRVPGVGRA